MHANLLHNGKILPTSTPSISAGQVGYLNGWGVFSTIRVFDGVLFAFERHWARMKRDAELLRVPMPPDAGEFRDQLLTLVEANQAYHATLRVAVIRNRGGLFEGEGITRDYDVVAFTTHLNDWGRGVKLGVQAQARHSGCMFAGTKVTSWCHNLAWLEAARAQGYDEVVLLDDKERVSECTSANIFAVTREAVLTPPLETGCLPGITREILLEDIRLPEFPVREEFLTLEELYGAEAVFITSTTRELLPVVAIGGRAVKQNDRARVALQEAFSAYCDRYVAEAKRRGEGLRVPEVHEPHAGAVRTR
jgi:branched-chain amino acid aminotransferase